jgi:hypothetical protein
MIKYAGNADSNFNAFLAAKVSGDVIEQTLDLLNRTAENDAKAENANSSYGFQKAVLSAAYLGKGTAIDSDS